MRFVDHQQAGPFKDQRQHPIEEEGVREPFGRNEQDIDRVGLDQLDEGLEAIVGPGVEGADPESHPLAGHHLVPHQGYQRRHDQGRAAPLVAQQPGGDEVDGRLAPPRSLNEEHLLAPVDDSIDHIPLVAAKVGFGIADHGAKQLEGALALREWPA